MGTSVFCMQLDEEIQLHLFELRHAEAFFALTERNREYLRPWMGWLDEQTSLETMRQHIRSQLQHFADNVGFQMGIWYRDQLVGTISFNEINWLTRKVVIGYWLDGAMQGKGLMTRACRALISCAFLEYKLNKVEIHCAVGNQRSRAIPERLGFAQEGIIRQNEWLYDHYVDQVFYGMLASEWKE